MIAMMTPVLEFLRAVADEQEPEQPLTELLRGASRTPVSQVHTRDFILFQSAACSSD